MPGDGNSFTSSLLNPGIRSGKRIACCLDELKDPQNPPTAKGMLRLFASIPMLSCKYSVVQKMIFDGMDFMLANPI